MLTCGTQVVNNAKSTEVIAHVGNHRYALFAFPGVVHKQKDANSKAKGTATAAPAGASAAGANSSGGVPLGGAVAAPAAAAAALAAAPVQRASVLQQLMMGGQQPLPPTAQL